jgi:predicted nuclease of restriction endonuclease-like RecB superfamily
VGRTYDELIEELEGIEEINYRLIRGLAQILERRCSIESDAVIDSIAARKMVFEESRGFITSKDERERVLDKIARKLSIEPDDLEKALWADQEGNLVIKEFQTIAPEDLLRHYNLSLAQTLLFRATGMEIQIEDNYQPVFRKILSVPELLNIFPLYSEIDQLRKSPYMVCDSCCHHGCPLHPFSFLLVYSSPQTFMRLNEMIYSEIDI